MIWHASDLVVSLLRIYPYQRIGPHEQVKAAAAALVMNVTIGYFSS